MFKFFAHKMVVLFFGWVSIMSCSQSREDILKVRETKELYDTHYNNFEKYVFKNRSDLWWGRKTGTVGMGAKVFGYDDFTINTCIPASYSFFDRNDNDIKSILKDVGDRYIDKVDLLLEKCSKNPSDLNWVAHATYDEGKRLEREKIQKTGEAVSELERDTFVAAGLFVRYWVEKKISF